MKYGIVSHPSTIVHTYGAGRPTPTNTDIRFTDIGLRLEAMEFGIGNAEFGKLKQRAERIEQSVRKRRKMRRQED